MDRRRFLAAGLAAGAASLAAVTTETQNAGTQSSPAASAGGSKSFKLKYAPHFGMFEKSAGKELVDQLKYAADLGFTAWEDNGMMGRPVDVQEKVAAEMQRLGMTMGVFVAHADFANKTFVTKDPESRKKIVEQMRAAVDVAKRVNAKWCTVVPDAAEPKLDWGYQTANVIDNLRACAEICEPAGLVMVLEPLNKFNHPSLFLTGVAQAYEICRAVNSPSCKILDDLYHQQVTEGNLIPNLTAAWDEIGYIQLGDNPGRKEPTTGEINFRNVFKFLHGKGYTGLLGMEHGMSKKDKEGEDALVAAYRACDDF
jgi:hydroxypyruvate isomerase